MRLAPLVLLLAGLCPLVASLATASGDERIPAEYGGSVDTEWADALAEPKTRREAKAKLFGGEGAAVPVLVVLTKDARADVAGEARWIVRALGLRIADQLADAGADDLLADVWDRRAVEAAKPPDGFRIEAPEPTPLAPEPMSAAWESGNGHGFTLEFCRGRWAAEGFVVDRIAWSSELDGPDAGTTRLETGVVPAVRARAALSAVRRLLTLRLVAIPGASTAAGGVTMDFHVRATLSRGAETVATGTYTGYVGGLGAPQYFAVEPALSKVLKPLCRGVEFRARPPGDADRDWLRARLVASKDDDWWVRERLLHVVAALGDRSFDAPLRDVIRGPLENVRRRHRYAIDAYAKLVGPDLRPTPFDDAAVEAVRARYLALWDR